MPSVRHSRDTELEVMRLKSLGMSHRQINSMTGVSVGAVSAIANRCAIPVSAPASQDDKKLGEFDWREWCEWIESGQKLKRKASWSQEKAAIELGDGKSPQILYQLGDLHIGAWGTDYAILRSITDEIKNLEGCWVALVGDLLEMAIRLRGVLEVCSQVLPPEQQVQFLESWLEEILDKIAFSLWCNHGVEREEKMSGVSSIKGILSKRSVYFNGIGHPDIKVGEQVYRVAASHKFRGNSMYDSTFGPKRYSRMEAHDRELIMQGDLHRPAISQYTEGGIEKVAITSGTLHLNSGYAKRYFSLRTLPVFPCVVLHHDAHRIVPFWNLDDALKYLGR
jgi:hypothetical protein